MMAVAAERRPALATVLSLQPPSPICHPDRRGGTCSAPFGRPTFTRSPPLSSCHPEPVTFSHLSPDVLQTLGKTVILEPISIDGKASRPTTALSLGNCSLPATTLSYLSSRAAGAGTCSSLHQQPIPAGSAAPSSSCLPGEPWERSASQIYRTTNAL